MSVVVFSGPTLRASEVRQHIDAICLPPAKHGDILRALEMEPKPRVLAIIDGYFRTVPAVRHKEILWALTQGVHVFGAASMGALRAAELHDFGMVGVGCIFSDYCSGRIEDDDEVAVEHGPPELDFLPLSEALVDIRATLEGALRSGVIGQAANDRLLEAAKQLFYPKRCWPALIENARATGAPSGELDRLGAWLPSGRVSRKRDDAWDMLNAIRDFMAPDPPPFKPGFTFQRTEVWDLDYEAARCLSRSGEREAGTLLVQDLLDELRLMPGEYVQLRRKAIARALSDREARRHKGRARAGEKERALRDWLRDQGIGLATALKDNRLAGTELDAFLEEQASVRWTEEALDGAAQGYLLNALRADNRLAPIAERAEAKQRALVAAGKQESTLETTGISSAALIGWFWRQAFPGQMQAMPAEALAQNLGFADASSLSRAILREYLFREYREKHGIPPRGGDLT